MKSKGLQFVSVCMALTVLLSSFSISVNKHICGDEVTDVSLFSHAEKCEMMAARSNQPSCHQPVKCCDNQTVLINNDFDKSTAINSVQFEKQLLFVAVIFSFPYFYPEVQEPLDSRISYQHPPPLNQDRGVLYETFLI